LSTTIISALKPRQSADKAVSVRANSDRALKLTMQIEMSIE
jgi:hypothetical protein